MREKREEWQLDFYHRDPLREHVSVCVRFVSLRFTGFDIRIKKKKKKSHNEENEHISAISAHSQSPIFPSLL